MTRTTPERHPDTAVETACLKVSVDPNIFDHDTTADYGPIAEVIGQDRAVGAISFGAQMRGDGFNIFAMGPSGSGRRETLKSVMRQQGAERDVGKDWVYVNNFEDSHRPRALGLPQGTGLPLRDAMATLIEDLAVGLPAAFEADEYKTRRNALEASSQSNHEERVAEIRERAAEDNIALIRTPMGLGFAPVRDGEVVKPEEFNQWPREEREAVQKKIEALQSDLATVFQKELPEIEKQLRRQIRALDQETARATIELEINEAREQFRDSPAIQEYLAAVEEDLVANFNLFLQLAKAGEQAPLSAKLEHPALRRYAVNVIDAADHGDSKEGDSARKIIEEPDPNYANLIGRIEYQPHQGALITDFTMIKPGALHRANGGFLILELRALLIQPYAWEALKRCLKTGEIRVASLADRLGLVSTISLEPDPIPLSVKVALIGDRILYYLLSALDPDFATLFKVQADFDDDIDRSPESLRLMAQMLAEIGRREQLTPFDRSAMAAMLEHASRLSDDAAKLSLGVEPIGDVMREAAHWASEAGAEQVSAEHVRHAVKERRHREGRLRERAVEIVSREIVNIDTEGAATGQVNGLAVVSLGESRFGRPSRITARTRLGTGKIIDIEREVKLGGPIHSKGVLILSSFLATRYGGDRPVSLSASLVFEQSYGGVDGDSASSAELYALLSALSGVALSQSFAVTGSVDQFGRVQAIGGVNEKIEGFFDVCAARGLTGEQGVLIPSDLPPQNRAIHSASLFF